MNSMQHQFWVTKKTVSRKLGGKEDACVVSSDAELDAKLELFQSIADSCVQLQRVIDAYQERLCLLAQEENALGRYLKEYGKAERNASAGQLMSSAGKALAYTGNQRLTVRPPLLRLHQEVETFRGRAVSDTRATVLEMERARTEYRAALSWMKATSAQQLDPDTGHGLEKFRRAQSVVRSSKVRFDRLMLACLQKVDLLAAARCNMFSHALVAYQAAVKQFGLKAADTLGVAAVKLDNVKPYDFTIVSELSNSAGLGSAGRNSNANDEDSNSEDRCKNAFFNAEYTDNDHNTTSRQSGSVPAVSSQSEPTLVTDDSGTSTGTLLDLSWSTPQYQQSEQDILNAKTAGQGKTDFLSGDFMPSSLLMRDELSEWDAALSGSQSNDSRAASAVKDASGAIAAATNGAADSGSKNSQVSWLSLFAELDPLANQDQAISSLSDRA